MAAATGAPMSTDAVTGMPCLAVHGGAGLVERTDAAFLALARAGLRAALAAGRGVLEDGGAALEAVEAAVTVLEDDPCFNAGRGSALTSAGLVEMDSAIIDGSSGRMGAVAGITALRHPVHAARLLLQHGPHVFMIGPGAEAFARDHGALSATQDWLITPRALLQLSRAQATAGALVPPRGTVGAVARDRQGHLAAATSTGGLTGKWPGRVGDTPVIGAGTWADERLAISCTGHGESFIRMVFAHSVAGAVRHGSSPREAVASALARIASLGGSGGCIVADRQGELVLMQHQDMFRAWWSGAQEQVAIFGDD